MDTPGQSPRRLAAATATPVFASIPRTCELTGVSRTRVYELIGQGRVRAVKDGRRTLVDLGSMLGFLRALPPLRPSHVPCAGVASGVG